MTTVAVIMACHNRRSKTVECLGALRNGMGTSDATVHLFLVDDGSTDGTADAVRSMWPDATIIRGDGNLYWNGGMRVAFGAAMSRGFDFYLWLNDDTVLYPGTLDRLLECHSSMEANNGRTCIVVGATQDPASGRTTYGGVRRTSGFRRLSSVHVDPSTVPLACDYFNGNCVLIPRPVAAQLGNLDGSFVHSMGDGDYGLRAKRNGVDIWLLPGYAGTCIHDHSVSGSFMDRTLPMRVRLRKMLAPKVLPIHSWRVYTARHAGILWPIYWLWPYVSLFCQGMADDVHRKLAPRKDTSRHTG